MTAPMLQDIKTAPRDGTIIIAVREAAPFGSMDTLVVCAWCDEADAFVWPVEKCDVFNRAAFLLAVNDDCFADDVFTEWMPLPDRALASL